MKNNCSLCHDVGWVLEQKHSSAETAELIPCPIPDCAFSGKFLRLLSVNECYFTYIAQHPKDGYI